MGIKKFFLLPKKGLTIQAGISIICLHNGFTGPVVVILRCPPFGRLGLMIVTRSDMVKRRSIFRSSSTKDEAFTLIELLVVIAVIAILMSILMPALSRVKELARQASCAARIRQHVLALNMYADDNNTKLPLPVTGGNWLQDISVKTVNFMLRSGMTRKLFYDPSNPFHQNPAFNDLYWMFTNPNWDGRKFTTETGFIVSGYCYILELSPVDINGNKQKPRTPVVRYRKDGGEVKIWLKTNLQKGPASKELVIDSIMGVPTTGAPPYGRNFDHITVGGLPGMSGGAVYDRTSHLRGKFPRGGNIGFLDTHTEWRRFDPEITSGVASPRFGNENPPGFFW